MQQPTNLAVRIWSAWVAIVHATMSFVLFQFPQLMESSAYSLAYDILPLTYWAWLTTLSALICTYSVLKNSDELDAFAGLLFALPIQMVFGYSIAALTFDGVTSAFLGAFQWWSVPAGTITIIAVRFRHTAALNKVVTEWQQ